MTIVVTGATGNIGKELTKLLVDSGQEVAVIARHPEKLLDDIRSKVRVEQGDLNDREFVVRATAGADALFWLTPPNMQAPDPEAHYVELGQIAAAAIQANTIGHVVLVSSIGAQDPDAGFITYSGYQEKLLSAVATNLYMLRNGFFMENLLAQVQSLREQGMVVATTSPTARFPMVATADIAATAVRKLSDLSWTGQHVLGVQGPEDLSYNDAAEILTEVLGKQIRYVQISEEQLAGFMVSIGATPAFAAGLARLESALDHPGFVAEPRTPETTTSTTLKQWAKEILKPALR